LCREHNYELEKSPPLKNNARDVEEKPVPGIADCTHLSTVPRERLRGSSNCSMRDFIEAENGNISE
jgi:hypothetical protein